MKRLDDSSIRALISLLDDPSDQIYQQIKQNIIALGAPGIQPLQEAFNDTDNDLKKERLASILDALKLDKINDDLKFWYAYDNTDLLSGLLKIAAYGDPNFNASVIKDTLNQIEKSIKEQLRSNDPFEVVQAMNQTILYDFGFNGNIRNYAGINNSFINKIVEHKISNPIGLSILYLIMAERLNIPLVGINSPGHFLLGYVNDHFSSEDVEDGTVMENIDFYIDPFHNGKTIENDEFDNWLQEFPPKQRVRKQLAATNESIIKRVMNNLIYALYTTGEKSTAQDLLQINESL